MSGQTTYSRNLSSLYSGQMADSGLRYVRSYLNKFGAAIPAGVFVTGKAGALETSIDLPNATSDVIRGVVALDYARSPDYPATLTGTQAYQEGGAVPVLEEGAIAMLAEQAMAVGDPVYCRITSDGGSNTQLGRLRKDSDSGRAVLVPGAHVLVGAGAGESATIWFSRSAQSASEADRTGMKQITLSAAAEAGNAIVVSGVVTDLNGTPVTSAVEVMVRTLAVTDNKGDITVTAGTERKTVNPATGENFSWITTTAAGAFAVSVANDVAEVTLVSASSDDALPANLRLTFA